jgi:hypothetical protein
MDNIQEIIFKELEPRRKAIESEEIELEPLVENIRQQVLLYMNDLFYKNVLCEVPQIVFACDEVRCVFFEMDLHSFYRACDHDKARSFVHVEETTRH